MASKALRDALAVLAIFAIGATVQVSIVPENVADTGAGRLAADPVVIPAVHAAQPVPEPLPQEETHTADPEAPSDCEQMELRVRFLDHLDPSDFITRVGLSG